MTIPIPDDRLLDAVLKWLRLEGNTCDIQANDHANSGESVTAFAAFEKNSTAAFPPSDHLNNAGFAHYKIVVTEKTRGGMVEIYQIADRPTSDALHLRHYFSDWLTIGLPPCVAEFLLECLTSAVWIKPAAVWKARNGLSSEREAREEAA